MNTLQRLYDNGIDAGIEVDWDGGFRCWIGHRIGGERERVGFRFNVPTVAECEAWLESVAREKYPNGKYTWARPALKREA